MWMTKLMVNTYHRGDIFKCGACVVEAVGATIYSSGHTPPGVAPIYLHKNPKYRYPIINIRYRSGDEAWASYKLLEYYGRCI